MRAVYNVVDCCGDFQERIEVDLPDDFDDPSDFDAEQYALEECSNYAGAGWCDGCGSRAYSARYAGFPVSVPSGVDMKISADSRDSLIEALERVLAVARDAEDYVDTVDIQGGEGCVG